jgi:hypothetical protein
MKTKLETGVLSALLLLLAVLVCPQTVLAQTGSDVQTDSGFPPTLPLNVANTTGINSNQTATTQPPAEEITQQNQMPLMIVIIIASFAIYIAVIAVLSSRKIR